MAGYEAPAVDMAFTLNEVVGLAELAELPAFNDVGLDIVLAFALLTALKLIRI